MNGPVTAAQLRELARSGQLQPTDMVKKEDMQKWLPASRLKGIFADSETHAPVSGAASGPPAQLVPTKASSLSLRENQALIGLSFLFCFPVGLFFVWTHSSWTKAQKFAWTGAFAGVFMMLMVFAILSQQATQKTLEEADRLWQAGQKAEAVTKYKSVLDNGVSSVDRSQRPTIFQRVIEFEAEQGNTSAAKALIQKATAFDVSVSFDNAAAKALLAEVQREKEQQVAQAKSGEKYDWDGKGTDPNILGDKEELERVARNHAELTKPGPGKKLEALERVVSRLEHNLPDRFADSATRQKYNWLVQSDIDIFSEIPFDPKENRKESVKIIEYYEKKVKNKYEGYPKTNFSRFPASHGMAIFVVWKLAANNKGL